MTEDEFDKAAEEYFTPEHHGFQIKESDQPADDFTE